MCWILPGGTTRLYSNLPEGITRLPPGSAGCLQASPDSPDAPGTGHSMTLLHENRATIGPYAVPGGQEVRGQKIPHI